MTSYELELREDDLDGVAVAELSGELDLTNVDELERRLDEIAAGASALALDLNGVAFLDSAALHVLFRLARRLELEAKPFAIALDPASPVAKTVSMVNLDKAAKVRPSLEDALADLRS